MDQKTTNHLNAFIESRFIPEEQDLARSLILDYIAKDDLVRENLEASARGEYVGAGLSWWDIYYYAKNA